MTTTITTIRRARPAWVAVSAFLAAAIAAAPVDAAGHAETVVALDPAAGELPEGVAVNKRGDVFMSLSPLGQLVRVPAGTDVVEPFGQIGGLVPGDIGLIGLAVDAPGNVYGAVVASAVGGVYRFDRSTGAAQLVPGTDAMSFPNSIAFDPRGNMFVTNADQGEVWRVPPGGSAELWVADPLLEGTGLFGLATPIGANGIAVRQGTVYVGNTEQMTIVSIPITVGGAAGTPTVWADVAAGLGTIAAVDGIALDVHGNVYVASPFVAGPAQYAVLRVSADGGVEVLADASDGLDAPTSVAFGTGRGAKQSVYAVNFSVALGFPLGAGPGLVKIDVGVPGLPFR